MILHIYVLATALPFLHVVRGHVDLTGYAAVEERTVKNGESISFNCVASVSLKANVSIEWTTPCSDANHQRRFLSENINSCKKRILIERSGVGGLRLTLEEASYLDTGFYVCQYGSQVYRRIYLFVKDAHHLLVPPLSGIPIANRSVLLIPLVFSQTNVLLGCAPSYPENVMITLAFTKNNITDKQISVNAKHSYVHEQWSYNPYYGFEIKKVESWENIVYKCSARLFRKPIESFSSANESRTEFIRHELQIIQSEITGGVEIMSMGLQDLSVNESEPFELKCRGKSDSTLDIRWQWIAIEDRIAITEIDSQSHPPGMHAVEVAEETFDGLGVFKISKLRWSSIPKVASGRYICYDNSNALLPLSFVNLAVGIGGPIIKRTVVTSGSNFTIYCNVSNLPSEVSSRALEIEWEVPPEKSYDYRLYYRNFIPLRDRLLETGHTNSWTLAVRNASHLDSGIYRCFTNLGNGTISYSQYVSVLDPWHIMLPPATRMIKGQEKFVLYLSEKNTLLGCPVTDPSIIVLLRRDLPKAKGVIVSSSLTHELDHTGWMFDKHRGFMLKKVDSWLLSGSYMCLAKRTKKAKTDKSAIQYARFEVVVGGLEVILSNKTQVVEGDKLNLTCRSKNIHGNSSLVWLWTPYTSNESVTKEHHSLHLNKIAMQRLDCSEEKESTVEIPPFGVFDVTRLSWTNVPLTASGFYECRDTNDHKTPPASVNLRIYKPSIPLLEGDSEESHSIDKWSELSLHCSERGALPIPRVRWFVSHEQNGTDVELTMKSGKFYVIEAGNHRSHLFIQKIEVSALYKCRFENWQGHADKLFYVTVKGPNINIYLSMTLVGLFVLILTGFALHAFYRHKSNSQERIHSNIQLLKGNAVEFNPTHPISEQFELLPYDPKWEFPFDRLQLGKHLGSGHYGRVVQAKADGIYGPGVTAVAVKTVKSHTNKNGLKSLISELKILMHLGSHLNVVNLLGAVTKNIVKGELMVIVELCRNGNLRDFLRNNRNHFIDQLDEEGKLKPISENHLSTLGSRKVKCHVKVEGKRDPVVTTHDLVEWSFQIACGMNYLTQKKVLHGDLAARNVLLADDNVVKIADFGLSRKFNHHDWNYRKKGKEPMPFKWMAIESIIDRTFTSHSDIWSFGVTMWELFSLSKEPYPEIEDGSQLIRCLRNGYRMEKPQFAPGDFKGIIMSCWQENPKERPTFQALEQAIGDMMDPQVRAQYAKAYDQFGYISFNVDEAQSLMAEGCSDESNMSSVNYLELTRDDNCVESDYRTLGSATNINC